MDKYKNVGGGGKRECDERIIWLDLAWDSWTEYELYYGRIRYDLKDACDQWLA